jgi:hypothetical protein
MAKSHSWTIDKRVVDGRETYYWAVLDKDHKEVRWGEEPTRAAAVFAAMKAIHQLER